MTDQKSRNLRIGTSGYSFDDWKGEFYPPNIEKGKMLDYYAQLFNTVEINSTYYAIPHPIVFSKMIDKVPSEFDFIVKVPQSFTHRRNDLQNDFKKFSEAIEPLKETAKLSGLLAQFPYSFKYNSDNLDYVSLCKDYFNDIPLFVEFRHNSWVNRTMYDRFRAENIGYVAVDEPQLSGLLKPDSFATTDTAYVRLHGRNAEQWWDGGDLRYDYSYSDSELQFWQAKIKKLMNKTKTQYVFFNNCHKGKAVANAKKFLQMFFDDME